MTKKKTAKKKATKKKATKKKAARKKAARKKAAKKKAVSDLQALFAQLEVECSNDPVGALCALGPTLPDVVVETLAGWLYDERAQTGWPRFEDEDYEWLRTALAASPEETRTLVALYVAKHAPEQLSVKDAELVASTLGEPEGAHAWDDVLFVDTVIEVLCGVLQHHREVVSGAILEWFEETIDLESWAITGWTTLGVLMKCLFEGERPQDPLPRLERAVLEQVVAKESWWAETGVSPKLMWQVLDPFRTIKASGGSEARESLRALLV